LGISVDCDGNSYVTGFFNNTATFGPHTLTTEGFLDIFVAKANPLGEWQWANSAGGPSVDRGLGISVDCDGNSYVTGSFENTATFGTIAITSEGALDIFVAKANPLGEWQWANSAGGPNPKFVDNMGNGISVDLAGNAYVTGSFFGTATFGTIAITTEGLNDIFIAKIPTTNCDPCGPLNLDCQLIGDTTISVSFDTNTCFTYDITVNSVPNRTDIAGTGGRITENFNLAPNQPYTFLVECKDKCGKVFDSASCTLRTICILPGATVLTPNGKKLIDDIRAGDIVVDENGKHVKVINNIRSGANKKKVITFKKGSLGIRKPDANLSITSNHPIKRLGKEVLVENCVNRHSIKSRYMMVSHTFTLLTEERCFIMTNGVPVATYSQADFEKQCEMMRARGTPLLYRLL
jgi:hypothetical protein